MGDMQKHWDTSQTQGSNAQWLEAVYEQYLNNPSSVEDSWKNYFDQFPSEGRTEKSHSEILEMFRNMGTATTSSAQGLGAAGADTDGFKSQVSALFNAYRTRGYRCASFNPLDDPVKDKKELDEDLSPGHYQIDENLLNRHLSLFSEGTLREDVAQFKAWYCGNTGWEYMHLESQQQRDWFRARIESDDKEADAAQRLRTLQSLVAAEGLEKFLAVRYSGAKRFGLEGGESLIPLLDTLVHRAGKLGSREVVLGMAHRGRLNVLVNLMGKPPRELCEEFEGNAVALTSGGDVKYHMGYSSNIQTEGGQVHLSLAFNPSHLAIVTPVVMGSVRARQDHRGYADGVSAVVPVLVHGDAAFCGQGVIMESLQMSQTRGFGVGGTVHIIINNQIGFTTSVRADVRSTPHSSDVAKIIGAPIIHVNGDDPDAVVRAARIALDYRNAYGADVVIDLVCYRRHGHNEVDEPAITQPMMYKKIAEKETVVHIYGQQLQERGEVDEAALQKLQRDYREGLDQGDVVAPDVRPTNQQFDWVGHLDAPDNEEVDTRVNAQKFRELALACSQPDPGYELHRQVEMVLSDRNKMAGGGLPVNWGFAEMMAYATILNDGYSLRITGQDVRRGTFAHRHVLLHDQKTGEGCIPLIRFSNDDKQFEIYDSLLSEEAVLAFEYGYSTTMPETLVIWEAQFGDFANGAQVVIDQFLTSGRAKWGRHTGLTLLLPHGYEGQGPEHSSARLERYLQLCADHNIEVCVPTTAAQIYHLLRRQILRKGRKPLIVMSPKSLLRSPHSVSSLDDLCDGSFNEVIDDNIEGPVERIVMCAGKVYYDLANYRKQHNIKKVAIIRIEQIYPFPFKKIIKILRRWNRAKDLVWCQEEPKNQGVWQSIGFRVHEMLTSVSTGSQTRLRYAGRRESASTAVGYAAVHSEQQKQLVIEALTGKRGVINSE